MEVFEFKDAKTVQDPIHDYPSSLRDSETPLIIDNGIFLSIFKTKYSADKNKCLFKKY